MVKLLCRRIPLIAPWVHVKRAEKTGSVGRKVWALCQSLLLYNWPRQSFRGVFWELKE